MCLLRSVRIVHHASFVKNRCLRSSSGVHGCLCRHDTMVNNLIRMKMSALNKADESTLLALYVVTPY